MRARAIPLLSFLCATTALLFLTACQQTGPHIETRKDDSVNFSEYQTYALLKSGRVASPDNEIAQYFIQAIREQMDARGYTYSEEQQDLLINYQVNIQNLLKEMGSAEPARVTEGGYYSHSQELYRGMPATQEHTQIFIERKGAARIDIIDAQTRQLIWQGDAQGRLTEEALLRPKDPIRATVSDLLREFPERK